jgi:2-phosphosulfolactate phosphatase
MKTNGRICWDDGELEGAVRRKLPILMIDTLRATSTIVTAFARGADSVRVVEDDPDPRGDEIRLGEAGGMKLAGFDYDNSPSTINKLDLGKRRVLLRTTNFSKAYVKAATRTTVYAGSFLNLGVCLRLVSSLDECSIYPCRRKGKATIEDSLAALIIASGEVPPEDDLLELVRAGGSARNLIALGKEEDVLFSCRISLFDLLPVSRPDDGLFKLNFQF